jgi:thiamine biosynthesis lipoprotein
MRSAESFLRETLLSRSRFFYVLWFLFLCLTGCSREPLYQSQSYVFGTLVDISIYGETEDRAQALSNHIEQEFQRLHDNLHAWKPGGELFRLNKAFAAGQRAAISPEVADILRDATVTSQRSQGLFNPSIGALIGLWGFQRDEFTPVSPDPDQIAALVKANPSMTDLVIEGSRISSRNRAVQLDLGGYAKGYALDLASDYLRQQKVKSALINIGGNIIAIGKHGNQPWRVGIQHPRHAGAMATLDLPDGWAIGTSGDYQRYFELNGKRYCHIIDPRSGFPANGVQSVTVLIPPQPHAGALSDADSKPLFISGKEHWREAAQQLGLQYAMLVDQSGAIQLTPDMGKRIRLEAKTNDH